MTSPSQTSVGTGEIERFVADWYRALDRHVPFEDVEAFLDDEIRFEFPETTVTTYEGLRGWYDTVTNRFFDEEHTVDRVDATLTGDVAEVHVVVTWATRVWTPPEPNSQLLTYQSDQDWEVRVAPDGRPLVRTYRVNNLIPQGDTPELF